MENLRLKLTFLAEIPPDAKPCFETNTIVYNSSWWGHFYRYWNGESRYRCYYTINAILDDVSTFSLVANSIELRELYQLLIAAKNGLINLNTTFRGIYHNLIVKLSELIRWIPQPTSQNLQ